jgi:hypothetical protein
MAPRSCSTARSHWRVKTEIDPGAKFAINESGSLRWACEFGPLIEDYNGIVFVKHVKLPPILLS